MLAQDASPSAIAKTAGAFARFKLLTLFRTQPHDIARFTKAPSPP